jgi:hypothetical protein
MPDMRNFDRNFDLGNPATNCSRAEATLSSDGLGQMNAGRLRSVRRDWLVVLRTRETPMGKRP